MVALHPSDADPPYMLAGVTVDPAEGESRAALGSDFVDTVPMPPAVEAVVADFVSQHFVEQALHRRRRDRPDTEALGRRPPVAGSRKQ